jgi:putative FmdB family regulatory protein
MPIYEYECTHCHHQLDALQKFSDAPLTHCPKCNQETLVKLISAASFQLKGTGWYVTDFRDKQKPATDNTTKATDTSKPSDAKTDTSTDTTKKTESNTNNGEAA